MQKPQEIEVSGRTPEELVQILDARIAMYRMNRADADPKRAFFLTGAILILICGTAAGLFALFQILPDYMHSHQKTARQVPAAVQH